MEQTVETLPKCRLETAIRGCIEKLGRTDFFNLTMGIESKGEYRNCNCVIVVKSAT